MDGSPRTLVRITGHGTLTDEDESIEGSSVREMLDNDSQGNGRPDEISAANSVHGLEESFAGNSPTGRDSGDGANNEEAATSLVAAQARGQDTNDNSSTGDALFEISDEGVPERYRLDHDTIEAIIAAAMETANNDANSDDVRLPAAT
ncbi:hypothetical protein BDW75DRAFT_244862 [Aspergillus navahoensis]